MDNRRIPKVDVEDVLVEGDVVELWVKVQRVVDDYGRTIAPSVRLRRLLKSTLRAYGFEALEVPLIHSRRGLSA